MVEPFKPEHLFEIDLQPAQADARAHFPDGYAELLAAAGPAITVRWQGRIVACYGIGSVPGADRPLLWGFLAAHVSPWRAFTAARALIYAQDETVYATAAVGCQAAERALVLLGFSRANFLPGFGYDGGDHTLFVRAAA